MALVLKDRVKETSTSTGTGDFVLAGAETGFQSFASALADGDTTYYAIEDGTDWETGLGTWTESTSTLARTTVYESSNSGNAVDWGAGTKNVFITQPASRVATTTVYASVDDLPLSGNVQAGDQAFVTGNNRLYLFNGSGWYNIALLNLTPTIDTQPDANYGFDTYGTALTVTLAATDPEGFPLTWSANTTGMAGLATLSQNNNAFTFTPSTDAADQGQSFTATFSVTDGINTAVSNQTTFTIGIDQLSEPSVGTVSIVSPTGQAEFISGLSALWKDVSLSIGTSPTDGLDNSTFLDRSTNAHTVTTSGTPTQTAFHPYLDNWSVDFNGSGDYLTASNSSEFDLSSGDFTFEGWFNLSSASGTDTICAVWAYSVSRRSYSFGLLSGKIGFTHSTDGAAGTISENPGSTTISTGEWVHLAWSRSGNTLRGFINGVEDLNITLPISLYSNTTDPLSIGTIGPNYELSMFDGYMSNLRMVKGTALYTANFTPPTEKLTAVSGTSLLTCQSNRFIDNSASGHAITVAGNPVASAFNPFGQESEYAAGENKGSTYFNGSNQGLSIANDTTIQAKGDDFTFECWTYPESSSGGTYRIIFGQSSSGVYSPLNVQQYGVALAIGISSNGSSWDVYFQSAGAMLLNAWNHIVVVREGSNFAAFLNGTRVHDFTSSATLMTPTQPTTLGVRPSNDQDYLGYISDCGFSVGTANYDPTSTSITPPTAPVGNTNASLYLPMDNLGVFDKTGNHTLTVVGDASTSTTQTKFADTAMYFDGSGDYLKIPASEQFNFGTGDFTIELWAYKNSTSSYLRLFGNQASQSETNTFNFLYTLDGSDYRFQVGSSPVADTNAPVPTNVWHHIACVRQSGVLKIYIDGVEEASASFTSDLDTTNNFLIGQTAALYSDRYFNGYIENFQVLKGVAKYTSNFTVPDKEQGRTYQAES